jgi:hypothetical protein
MTEEMSARVAGVSLVTPEKMNSPPVAHELAITTADEQSYAIFSRVSVVTRFREDALNFAT